MEIHTVGAKLFRADGPTDMTEVVVALRNFACASKNDVCGENKIINCGNNWGEGGRGAA